MTDLNELKKLALASTPVGEVVRYEHGGGRMFNGTDLIADTFEEADREFYAVARQECLDLIARLERAEKALAYWEHDTGGRTWFIWARTEHGSHWVSRRFSSKQRALDHAMTLNRKWGWSIVFVNETCYEDEPEALKERR